MRLRAQFLQEAGQVLCMLFFLRKNPLQDFTSRGIIRADIGDHFAIAVDRDPFGNQVFRDHLHQGRPFDIFRVAPTQHPFRGQIRLTSKLDNAFGQLIGMDLFLCGMLEKLALHAEGTDPGGHEVMALIAKDAHDFCGEGFIQQR